MMRRASSNRIGLWSSVSATAWPLRDSTQRESPANAARAARCSAAAAPPHTQRSLPCSQSGQHASAGALHCALESSTPQLCWPAKPPHARAALHPSSGDAGPTCVGHHDLAIPVQQRDGRAAHAACPVPSLVLVVLLGACCLLPRRLHHCTVGRVICAAPMLALNWVDHTNTHQVTGQEILAAVNLLQQAVLAVWRGATLRRGTRRSSLACACSALQRISTSWSAAGMRSCCSGDCGGSVNRQCQAERPGGPDA